MSPFGQQPYGQSPYGQGADAQGPRFRAQVPAPGADNVAAETTVYAEVIDAAGGLIAGSVQIYINGTLAWLGARPAPGFSGARAPVSLGYGYTIVLPSHFGPGLQSVRGTAQDSAGNAMDETYTFSTVPFLVTDEVVESLVNRDAGIDLYLDETHDLVVDAFDLQQVVGANEVKQHLTVGLRLFRGEWYLDEDAGVPYYRDVFADRPRTRIVETVFRQEVLNDPDVGQVRNFGLDSDRATRRLGVSFVAVSTVGDVEVEAVLP